MPGKCRPLLQYLLLPCNHAWVGVFCSP
jgi:hypothetical protein